MSGFSSLLNQFKQTTAAAASSGGSISTSRGGGGSSSAGAGAADSKKRPRSIFESNQNLSATSNNGHTNKTTEDQTQYHFPTTPVKTIYIACPAFAETGGPEALHQLCHVINTGGYTYEDVEDTPKFDEFGRAITGKSNTHDDDNTDGNKKVVRAYMLYLRERNNGGVEHVQSSRARSSKYDRYDVPAAQTLPGMEYEYANRGDDGGGNEQTRRGTEYSPELVIWPECWTHLIDSLQPSSSSTQYDNNDNTIDEARKKSQIAIWWLSVNNNKGRFIANQFVVRRDILHLVQSAYAREYVTSKLQSRISAAGKKGGAKDDSEETNGGGLNVMILTEFIPYASPTFALPTSGEESEETIRDLDVVYNTAKGMHYTDEIIRRACGKKFKTNTDGSVAGGGIKFNPIGKGEGGRERMTGEEVVALLKRSKVYIDFGPHPGMDRLPREAALAGCVVVTNRDGAANFNEDVPLPAEFKFRTFDSNRIYTMLKDCCNNHEEYAVKMKPYREWILGQEKEMVHCVDRLVDRVVNRRLAKTERKG